MALKLRIAFDPVVTPAVPDKVLRQVVQARAEQLLARCDRVLFPLPAGGGSCWCGSVAVVGLAFWLDGTEMAWVLSCEAHKDAELKLLLT